MGMHRLRCSSPRLVAGMLAVALIAGGLATTGVLPAASAQAAPATLSSLTYHAPPASIPPRRSPRPLTVGLPTGCNPNIVNGNTSLGANNGNGLGETRFFTYDALSLDDHAQLKVNVANGNLVLHLDLLHIKGTLLDEDVAAFYNIQGSGVSEIGDRWVLSPGPDVKLIVNGTTSVTFDAPSDYQATFTQTSPGINVFYDAPGLDATLISNSGGSSYALNFHKTGECFAFNSAGQLTADSEKNGHQLAFAYNGSGLLSTITDTQNRVTSFSYNSHNLLSTITDPIGRTISFTYDSTNTYLDSITDAVGDKTQFGYDSSSGNLTSVTDPHGDPTKLAYTSKQVTKLTDALGNVTTFAYGVSGTQCSGSGIAANQLTNANQGVTTYCYSTSTLQVRNAFDPLGHERSGSYTPDYNVSKLTDPLSNNTTFNWSADGKNNLSGVTDATGASTTFNYGSTNPYLPSNTTDTQGTVLAYTYDSPGNLQKVKDNTHNQNLLLDTYTYSSSAAALIGTLTTATNGDNQVTSFGYDANGNLNSVTPPSGGVLGATTLTYDGVSRVTSVTDGRGLFTQFFYDKDDRLTAITYNDGSTVTFAYGPNGGMYQEVDANGTTTISYDKDNRELTKQQPNGFSFTYGYGPLGNLTSLADPGGTVTYKYDAASRLTSLTEPDGTTTVTFGYNNDDQRTTTSYPNKVTQTIGYDNAGRETSVVGKKSDGTLLTSFTYCYLPVPTGTTTCPTSGTPTNLRTLLTDGVSGDVTAYSYDTQNRLTEAKTTTSGGGTTVSDYRATPTTRPATSSSRWTRSTAARRPLPTRWTMTTR